MGLFKIFNGGGVESPRSAKKQPIQAPPAKPVAEGSREMPKIRGEVTKSPLTIERELGEKDKGLEASLEDLEKKIVNLRGFISNIIQSSEGDTKNSPEGVRKLVGCLNNANTYLSELKMIQYKPRYENRINFVEGQIEEVIEILKGRLPKIITAQDEITKIKSKKDLEALVIKSHGEVEFISKNIGTDNLPDFDAEDDLLLEIRPDLLKRKSNEIGAGIEKTDEYESLKNVSLEAKKESWF